MVMLTIAATAKSGAGQVVFIRGIRYYHLYRYYSHARSNGINKSIEMKKKRQDATASSDRRFTFIDTSQKCDSSWGAREGPSLTASVSSTIPYSEAACTLLRRYLTDVL